MTVRLVTVTISGKHDDLLTGDLACRYSHRYDGLADTSDDPILTQSVESQMRLLEPRLYEKVS